MHEGPSTGIAIKRRRRAILGPVFRGVEVVTVYLLGVPNQGDSDESDKQKAPDSVKNQGLACLVAWGGIEPPTQGFSVPDTQWAQAC